MQIEIGSVPRGRRFFTCPMAYVKASVNRGARLLRPQGVKNSAFPAIARATQFQKLPRLLAFSSLQRDEPQVEVGVGLIGRRLDSLLQYLDRLFRLPQLGVDRSQQILQIGRAHV